MPSTDRQMDPKVTIIITDTICLLGIFNSSSMNIFIICLFKIIWQSIKMKTKTCDESKRDCEGSKHRKICRHFFLLLKWANLGTYRMYLDSGLTYETKLTLKEKWSRFYSKLSWLTRFTKILLYEGFSTNILF